MKKANLYILSAGILSFLGFYLLTPLSGRIFIHSSNQTNHPKTQPLAKDPLSKFMLNFSNEITADPISLDAIDHIILLGEGNEERPTVEVTFEDSARVECLSPYYLVETEHQIDDRTLTIKINDKKNNKIRLLLNHKNRTVTMRNLHAYVRYDQRTSLENMMPQYIFSKRSDVIFLSPYSGQEPRDLIVDLKIDEQSKVKFLNTSIQQASVTLNDGLLDLTLVDRLDTLSADFQGLSHILGVKKKENIASLTLTGNLDYYNQH